MAGQAAARAGRRRFWMWRCSAGGICQAGMQTAVCSCCLSNSHAPVSVPCQFLLPTYLVLPLDQLNSHFARCFSLSAQCPRQATRMIRLPSYPHLAPFSATVSQHLTTFPLHIHPLAFTSPPPFTSSAECSLTGPGVVCAGRHCLQHGEHAARHSQRRRCRVQLGADGH